MRRLLGIILILIIGLPAYSQNREQADSLVVLMSSKSAQLVDIQGASYRKVVGPTLGSASIKAGMISFAIAFVPVHVYMMVFYAGAGVAACVALR